MPCLLRFLTMKAMLNKDLGRRRLILVAAILALVIASCRDKDDNIIGPGPGPSGEWRIELENTTTLYVPNDTVDVRLFDPTDVLATGRLLRFRCEEDSGRITASASTTTSSWGCNPPLLYWGNGSDDQENPNETIHAYYISGAETLAHAFRSYRIQQRP